MFVNFVPNFSYFGDKKVFADSIPSITYTRFFQNFVAQKIWQRSEKSSMVLERGWKKSLGIIFPLKLRNIY